MGTDRLTGLPESRDARHDMTSSLIVQNDGLVIAIIKCIHVLGIVLLGMTDISEFLHTQFELFLDKAAQQKI